MNAKFTIIGALLLIFSAELGNIIFNGTGLPEISFLSYSTSGLFQTLVAAVGGSMVLTGTFRSK